MHDSPDSESQDSKPQTPTSLNLEAQDAKPQDAKPPAHAAVGEPLTHRQIGVLLTSVLVISICGLIYELIIGTLSSYLLGSSVTHFSITIGAFLFAMGVGSYLSRFVRKRIISAFVLVEIITGLTGGIAAVLLFGVFAFTSYFYFYVAMFSAILIIGGCMGLEIPLLTRIVSTQGTLRDNLAHVFSFDYLGALIGSLLFPLVLLRFFGLMGTAFATGVLNLVIAILVILAFRKPRRTMKSLLTLACVGIAILVVGFFSSSRISRFYDKHLYSDRIVYTEQTHYQKIVMTRYREDLRLFLDGSLQFSLADEYRYHEALIHPAMTLAEHPQQILILGGGDGLAAKRILQYPTVGEIVLVDIDPSMTNLAREHIVLRKANDDSMRDPRVTIINEDAFNYIARTSRQFDVIISDLPDPRNEALSKLYSTVFYRKLLERLAPHGMLAIQATSPYFARDAYWTIVSTLEAQRENCPTLSVYPYHTYVPSFGDWGFVLASPSPFDPEQYQPELPVAYFDPPTFTAARIFSADITRTGARPSTLDRPTVLAAYEEAWKHWR